MVGRRVGRYGFVVVGTRLLRHTDTDTDTDSDTYTDTRARTHIHTHTQAIEDDEMFSKLAAAAASAGQMLIVDFHASWCAPCKQLAPVFRAIALRTPTAIFAKIDVDENEVTTQRYPCYFL